MIRYSKPYVSKFSKMVSSEEGFDTFIKELYTPSSMYMKMVNQFLNNSNIPLELSFTKRIKGMAEKTESLLKSFSSTPFYVYSNGFTKDEIKKLLINSNIVFINLYYPNSKNNENYKDLPEILSAKIFNRIILNIDDDIFELSSKIDLNNKNNEYVLTLRDQDKKLTEEELEEKYYNSSLYSFITKNKWFISHLVDTSDIIYGHRAPGFATMSLDNLFLQAYVPNNETLNTNEIIDIITNYKYLTFLSNVSNPETQEELLINKLYDLIVMDKDCYSIYKQHSDIYKKYWREMKYPKKKRCALNILCDIEETIHPDIPEDKSKKPQGMKHIFPIYIQPYTSDKAYKSIFNKEEIFHITPQELELYEGELVKVNIWKANLFNIVLTGLAEDIKKLTDNPDKYSIHDKISDAIIQKFAYKKKKIKKETEEQ